MPLPTAVRAELCVLALALEGLFTHLALRWPSTLPQGAKNEVKELKPDPEMQNVLQTLYASGASLLLSGHDHGYEQFVRQNGYEQFEPQGAMQNPIRGGVRYVGRPVFNGPGTYSKRRQLPK